jgi:putative beta-lysine N-acetyltransferase
MVVLICHDERHVLQEGTPTTFPGGAMPVFDLEIPEPQVVLDSLSAVALENHSGPVMTEFALPGVECPAILDPLNRRLKVYEIGAQEMTASLVECADLAGSTHPSNEPPVIGKVTAYALPGDERVWEDMGFRQEAVIRGFYPDGIDAHLWAAYPNPYRESCSKELVHEAGVAIAESKAPIEVASLPIGYESRLAEPTDAGEIAELMSLVFPVYPSPIDEALIEEQIRSQSNLFRVVEDLGGDIIALASAEIDHGRSSAEMTDCATRPDMRGRGLMAYILAWLEQDLRRLFGLTDLYTIARADEIAMNCVFSKLGYDFTGRLINNCRMPNGWESMNVWCKSASPA